MLEFQWRTKHYCDRKWFWHHSEVFCRSLGWAFWGFFIKEKEKKAGTRSTKGNSYHFFKKKYSLFHLGNPIVNDIPVFPLALMHSLACWRYLRNVTVIFDTYTCWVFQKQIKNCLYLVFFAKFGTQKVILEQSSISIYNKKQK